MTEDYCPECEKNFNAAHLTLAAIKEHLDNISRVRGDDEAAHIREDALWALVLQHIADDTCENPKEAAALVLKSQAVQFGRYCA